jgi:probable selenate reductase FAD-binding subunit
MWSSLVEYLRPKTLNSALHLLSRQAPNTVPLAGGTWLVARRDPPIQALVDLSGLNLAFVEKSARRVRLGAMTTLQTLVEHPLAQEVGGGFLAEAARRSAPLTIRNIATLGGTLITGESTSEVLLALLALDARAVFCSPLKHEVTLEAFLADRPTHLSPHALLKEIYLPTTPPGSGTAQAEISPTPRDYPIVNAAALVVRRGRTCRMARLALGGVAPYPIRLPDVEAMFCYQSFRDDLLSEAAQAVTGAIDPPDDFRASAAYRRAMAAIVAERALREAWKKAAKE